MSGSQKQQQSKQTQAKSIAPKTPEQAPQNVSLEQLIEAPETMRPDQVLAAQKQVGNQVVQRALDSSKRRNAVTDQNGYLNDEIAGTIQKKRGSGSPLPDSLQKDVSKRFKRDFDDVRIHTDEQAHDLSKKINARAFTIGKDIFFKKGVFAPGSSQGRETIMHELTHVVQQAGGGSASGRLKLGAPDTSHEKQADKVGKANSSVDTIHAGSAGAAVQKQGAMEDEELLQGQPDVGGLIQRESMQEEEELQAQPDAGGLVQRMEEEELQAQPEAGGLVQRMEEDELQAQPDAGGLVQRMEEEELQAQPDVGGVVQRDFDIDSEERRQRKGVFETLGDDVAKKDRGGVNESIKTQQAQKRSVMGDIRGFDKSQLKKVDPKNIKDRSAPKPRMTKEEKHDLSKKVSRRDLMETLKDPSKSPEDIEKAKSMLKDMHGVKSKEFKKASKERTNALKTAAEAGDKEAYSKWKGEKKPSKFAGGALSLAKGFFGSAAKDLKTQLFGEEKKEEKKDAPVPASGGGSGVADLLEKKIAENQKLRGLLTENKIEIPAE